MNDKSENSEFDLVILGGGASGLLVLDHILDDPYFSNWKILLVEKEQKTGNDRTWCYWEEGQGRYDDFLVCEWDKAVFKNSLEENCFSLLPYRYKMLRSSAFYQYVYQRIKDAPHVTFINDEVLGVKDTGVVVQITLSNTIVYGQKCLNSIRNLNFLKNLGSYPLVQQHFIGWFVETEDPVFQAGQVTLMDFSVEQKGNTRFMYILPLDSNKALLEYTLFSPDLLTNKEYEAAIHEYLNKIGVTGYRLLEKEQGNIPMTAFPFHKENTKNMMYIGTAGGWTKASTGYTFHNAMGRASELLPFLKKETDLRKFKSIDRFDFYDRIFLNVLYRHNERGAELFSRMFLKRNPVTILKFLDNASSVAEEMTIISAMPKWLFVKNIF